MARISLSPSFLRDSFNVFRQRGIKGLILGTKATLNSDQLELIDNVEKNFSVLHSQSARKGKLHKIDTIHKGRGTVFLVSDPKNKQKTLLVFGTDTKIANGPDLWLYVSDSKRPKKDYGDYINLGLLKGNKGAQIYGIDKPIDKMDKYRSVIIYCKQFDVLFSYALLT